MLNVLNKEGYDEFDAHSMIFGVWYHGEVLATLRLTPAPFEMTRYLAPTTFHRIVGSKIDETIELSRLLTMSDVRFKRIMPALITYSGLCVCLYTRYKYYIGYSKPKVFERFNQFMCSANREKLSIPERGDHIYEIIQGKFRANFFNVLRKKMTPGFVRKTYSHMMKSK